MDSFDTSRFVKPRQADTSLDECSRLVVQGTLEDPIELNYDHLFFPEQDIIFPRDCDIRDIVDSLALMADGQINPGIVPVSKYSYTDAAEAYERLVQKDVIRVLFTWD